MLERVSVPVASRQYESIVGWQILHRTGELVREVLPPSRCAVITDSHVGPLYADVVTRSLEQAGFEPTVIAVAAGEESKSMGRVETVCDRMIEAGLDRGTFVVALGGGVIGDLAGFVASIYYRGMPHVQIPTTVVAQVDSAIGGKTGVNAREGKNLIGSFHQPVQVITDPALLASLPDREFNEGVAEIVKHAVIRDAAMLADLPAAIDSNPVGLIARNQQIKAQIVSEDEFEKTRFAGPAQLWAHDWPCDRKCGRLRTVPSWRSGEPWHLRGTRPLRRESRPPPSPGEKGARCFERV